MSASSWWVTCGIITQLRARLGPEIFLIRESGTRSTSPYFAKSTLGHGARFRPGIPAPVAVGAAAAAAGANVFVAGSALYRDDQGLAHAVADLRARAEAARRPD